MRISDWSSDVCSSDLHGFAIGVFDAVDIDFDFVADVEIGLLARHREFAKRHAAFALQADVDHCQVVFDRGHGALDDAAFKAAVGTTKRFRSEEHTSELQSLMRISYAVFCLKKKKHHTQATRTPLHQLRTIVYRDLTLR